MKFPNPIRFAGFLVRMVWARLLGYKILAEPEVQNSRRRYCSPACLHYLPDSGQCGICSCFTFAKTMLAVEKCPKGWWGPVWYKRKKSSLTKTNNLRTS